MPKGVYQRTFRPIEERLWKHIMPIPHCGCWIWMGSLTNGYGQIMMKFGDRYRPTTAHIVAYRLYKGPTPEGLELDHLCRVRSCCNPDHLEPVTHQVNAQRGIAGAVSKALAANRTHCRKGHRYSDGNEYSHPDGGGRNCRACCAEATRRYREKRRAS